MSHSVGYATRQLSGYATICKSIFECRPVPVSRAILQVWVKVINEIIVRVTQPVVKKAWTVVHAFLWWRGGTTSPPSRTTSGSLPWVHTSVCFLSLSPVRSMTSLSKCCSSVSTAAGLSAFASPSYLHDPRSWIPPSCILAVGVNLSICARIFHSTGLNFSS